jgi:hypothetical protein
MRRNIFVSVVIGLLLATLVSGRIWQSPLMMTSGFMDQAVIDTSTQYSNGSISSPHQDLALWYTWINTNSTQIIYLAYHSYIYNPPVVTFLGQHYQTEKGTEIFVGNTLTSLEVYNDTNGNGVPDVDFDTGTGEILYYFLVNSSVSCEITPIEKSLINGTPYYTWGIRYNTIDGFLIFKNQSGAASVLLDYISFSYDFYIQNNVSYLKTNFSIGKTLEITPFSNANVTLDGLSLSLLYGTTVITPKPYVTLVDRELYNSTTTGASVEPIESGEIRVEDVKTYEFIFRKNYTLFWNSQEEIHESQSAAVPNRSVSTGVRVSVEWLLSNLEDILSDLFPTISGMQTAINLDYAVSSFIYRVCYPKWHGYRLEHDPTYVAYLNTAMTPEISPPPLIVVVATLLGLMSLAMALVDLKRTRKMLTF